MAPGPLRLALIIVLLAGCATNKARTPTATSPTPLTEQTPAAPKPAFVCDEDAGDWPMFQRTPFRDGAVVAKPIAKPQVAWSREIGIASWLDNPIIAGGRVYAPSSGQVWNRPDGADGIYAFDLATGDELWFAATADDANGAAYENCRVFVGSDAGTVSAIDARTGDVLWTSELGGKVYSNPLPLGDRVIVGGDGGMLVALDVETGGVLWRRELQGTVRGGAASDGENLYVTTENAAVTALKIDDGSLVWNLEFGGPSIVSTYAAPTISRGKLYVSLVRDTYYEAPAIRMIDPKSSTMEWVGSNPHDFRGGWANIRSSPAVYDGRLFWGEAYSNRIVGLDGSNGKVSSSVAAGLCTFQHWPSPAVAQNIVYLPRHDGTLYAYDAEAGAVAWSLYLGDSRSLSQDRPPEHREASDNCLWEPPFGKPIYASPAIANDGSVAVSTGDGWLHVIRDAAP